VLRLFFIVVASGVAVLILADIAVSTLIPSNAQPGAMAAFGSVVIVASCVATMLVKRRREAADRSSARDGLERRLAIESQAKVMIDAVVVSLAVGCAILFVPQTPSAAGPLVLTVFIVVDFYLRYAIQLRRAKGK
jgi:small-conductance mechanosensitive channel